MNVRRARRPVRIRPCGLGYPQGGRFSEEEEDTEKGEKAAETALGQG